jgi:pyruvate decarboxylase
MATYIDLAEYLFRRIRQVGVKAIHGVPGDYNLTALDYIEPAGLDWVGNANELNAGYAADGYARIRGVSAVVTAFGVGELSAINAIAGAYSERAWPLNAPVRMFANMIQ